MRCIDEVASVCATICSTKSQVRPLELREVLQPIYVGVRMLFRAWSTFLVSQRSYSNCASMAESEPSALWIKVAARHDDSALDPKTCLLPKWHCIQYDQLKHRHSNLNAWICERTTTASDPVHSHTKGLAENKGNSFNEPETETYSAVESVSSIALIEELSDFISTLTYSLLHIIRLHRACTVTQRPYEKSCLHAIQEDH